MKYFKIEEFNCNYSGNNKMDERFLEKLDALRHECDFPFYITSGYRSPNHPAEARKEKPGTHSQGIAADIFISDVEKRYLIVKKAIEMGFTGIGVAKSFIHVDTRDDSPRIWTY